MAVTLLDDSSDRMVKMDKGVPKIYRNMHRVRGWGARTFFTPEFGGGQGLF